LNKDSASRFRFLFFTLTFAFLIVAGIGSWLLWKFYPILRQKGGWKELFNPKPYVASEEEESEE
jgi:type III secretion protein J